MASSQKSTGKENPCVTVREVEHYGKDFRPFTFARTMRQCAHERHLAEALWQEKHKPHGTILHGIMRFVSPLRYEQKNGTESELLPRTTNRIPSMKNAKGGLKGNHERAKKRTVAGAV